MKRAELAKRLVASELAIGRTEQQVASFVRQAARRGMLGVCVYQNMVLTAVEAAGESGLKVFTVAGFPSGIDMPVPKVSDVELSTRRGASGVAMGVNLSAWKSKDLETLQEELRGASEAAHRGGGRLSAVLNTFQLEDEEAVQLAGLCAGWGADAVKTTCGDSVIPRATGIRDVALIYGAVKGRAVVEAEGQISTLESALALLDAGAGVIYSSDAFSILDCAEE